MIVKSNLISSCQYTQHCFPFFSVHFHFVPTYILIIITIYTVLYAITNYYYYYYSDTVEVETFARLMFHKRRLGKFFCAFSFVNYDYLTLTPPRRLTPGW